MTEQEIVQALAGFSPHFQDQEQQEARLTLLAKAMALGYGARRLSRIIGISEPATRRLMAKVRAREDARFGLRSDDRY